MQQQQQQQFGTTATTITHNYNNSETATTTTTALPKGNFVSGQKAIQYGASEMHCEKMVGVLKNGKNQNMLLLLNRCSCICILFTEYALSSIAHMFRHLLILFL